MCNCGNKRAEYNKRILSGNAISPSATLDSNKLKTKFIYTGHSSLTVIGNISGHTYHFRKYGDVKEISSNDTSFMMTLPEVKML
jgi:hypothetical protein